MHLFTLSFIHLIELNQLNDVNSSPVLNHTDSIDSPDKRPSAVPFIQTSMSAPTTRLSLPQQVTMEVRGRVGGALAVHARICLIWWNNIFNPVCHSRGPACRTPWSTCLPSVSLSCSLSLMCLACTSTQVRLFSPGPRLLRLLLSAWLLCCCAVVLCCCVVVLLWLPDALYSPLSPTLARSISFQHVVFTTLNSEPWCETAWATTGA